MTHAEQPSHLQVQAWLNSLRQFRTALWHYRLRAALVFGAVLLLVIAGLLIAPSMYLSEAKLFVKVGRESITLDPTATTGQMISVYESRENEISSVLEVLQSRVILQRVVEKLGPDAILHQPTSSILGKAMGSTPPEPDGKLTADQKEEAAVRALSEMIGSYHTKKSSVISISCKATSPELAQEILQVFLTEFRQEHLRVNRTAGSYEFFNEQHKLLTEQLEQASTELTKAKSGFGLTSVEGHRKALEEQIAQIDSERRKTEANLRAAEAMIASLSEQLKTVPEMLVLQEVTGFPEGITGTAHKQLHQLRLHERELLSRYTPDHPLVQSVRGQIVELETLLRDRSQEVNQATRSRNPAYQQLELKLLDQQSERVAQQSRLEELTEQGKSLQSELRRLNSAESELMVLEQRVNLLKASHQTYAEKREQARIDQELLGEQISNVNVVQPPTNVSKAVSPKRTVMLILGLIVAAISSLGVAVGSAGLSHLARLEKHSSLSQSVSSPSPQESEVHESSLVENVARPELVRS